ncbi:MAG: succinate dehydrogenase cytochrome b subunit [Ornithinimicrobium sp.]|uniref:succinate dehydrogenase cytochrome b subunit n=1 Tax=Ornithinimicrobium sp. TaxID=1977084 RepID=UPI0026DEB4A2|nr:succinate dehydrogenase cytochrome b subunit [Ornithinimicrobium sp.]MDO5740385.1 succinate dehydrogenase cytochrome b subunit [Ornithinimicrobium sp.]
MPSPKVIFQPPSGVSSQVPGADREALALGHIRVARIRTPPRMPSWALKVVMALTGALFALFVFVHMIGNLKVFTGAAHFNEYAHWLRTVLQPFLPYEGLLWMLRIVLFGCLVAHVGAAGALWVRGRASRGPHRRKGMRLGSFSARTMLLTGIMLLVFIVIHVLDLTTGTALVAVESFRPAGPQEAHAYENLIASLQRPLAAGFYMLAMLALFLHLAHGLWTVVSDLGATGRRLRAVAYVAAGGVALTVTLGNIIIPVAVLMGVLK